MTTQLGGSQMAGAVESLIAEVGPYRIYRVEYPAIRGPWFGFLVRKYTGVVWRASADWQSESTANDAADRWWRRFVMALKEAESGHDGPEDGQSLEEWAVAFAAIGFRAAKPHG